jgi:hypothetical protein
VVTIEELQLVITAQVKDAVQNIGRARGEMSKFTQQAVRDAGKWGKLFGVFKKMFTGIVVSTRNMMHAIIEASPSMIVAMEDMSWQFEMMSYTVGEATAPVLEALVPIIEMMAEAFVGLPQPIMMMIGVMIMATAVGGQMTMMFGPLGLAIMAIVIAIAFLAKAWEEDWGGIQGKMQTVWAILQPIFWYFKMWLEAIKTAFDWLKRGIEGFIDTLEWLWDKIEWVIDKLGDLKDAIDKVGSYLPFSPAKVGPFSKRPRFDVYFREAVEPVKHIIETGLETPMATVAPMVRGGSSTQTTNVSYAITVNMAGGTTGSVLENEVAFENVMRRIQEEMSRRVT